MRSVEHWATTRRGKIIAGTLAVVLIVWQGGKMHKTVRKAGRTHGTDYECWVIGSRAVMDGEDLFAVRTAKSGRKNPCLPWFGVFMAPFVLMGYGASSILWPLVNLAALAASGYWCLKIVRGVHAPVPWPLWVVPPLLVVRALDSNSGLGQINVLILAAASGGAYFLVRGRSALAGTALAAATLVKLTPALLVAYCVWRRKWRIVAWMALAAVALVLVVPMPFYGVRGGATTFEDWVDRRILKQSGAKGDTGQSLRAMAHCYLTDTRASGSERDWDIRVNVASLSFRAAQGVYLASAVLVLIVLGVLTCGRASPSRVAGHLSLVFTAMLLVTPHTRKAHYVLLMLPMTFAYSRLALAERWPRRDKFLLAVLIVSFALTGLTARGIVTKAGAVYCDASATMGWGCLLLFVGIAVHLGWPSAPRLPSCGDA